MYLQSRRSDAPRSRGLCAPLLFGGSAVPALTVGALALAMLAAPSPLRCQSAGAVEGAAGGVQVGGALDEYLRYLQSLGRTPVLPWGLRGFAPAVVDSLTRIRGRHPWDSSWLFHRAPGPARLRALPVRITERFNSAYPYGINEGPVWAGRGLTSALAAGFAFAAGPFSAVVNPILFRAENTAFPLRPTGQSGDGVYRDPLWPGMIDRPQRFGNRAYTHLDVGETTLRVDFLGASLGATTANEWWGPATTFPFIVGNNAAGVPRVFISTQRPTNIFIGKIQARVEYGLEFQSSFSPVVGPDTYVSPDSSGRRRLMSGLAVTFSPAILPGLELDAGRYFHEAWTGRFTGSALRTPFEGLLKRSVAIGPVIPGIDARDALKNQLASAGFRWVIPHGGLDVYGEYGREDFAEDRRALYVQPDLSRVFIVGLRKAFQRRDSTTIDAVRAEVFDGNPTTMGLYRPEGRTYVHYPIRQGHTEEGKVIGAAAGVGATSAATLAWDHFDPRGSTSVYVLKRSENLSTEFQATPLQSATAGARALRFTRFGDVSADAALVRSTRVATGWGGWNVSLSGGVVLRF